jgi:hypothetical protein
MPTPYGHSSHILCCFFFDISYVRSVSLLAVGLWLLAS